MTYHLQRGSKEDLIGLSNSHSAHTTGNPRKINLTNKTFTEYCLHNGNKAEEQWKVGMNLTDLQSENDMEDSYKTVLGQEPYLNSSSIWLFDSPKRQWFWHLFIYEPLGKERNGLGVWRRSILEKNEWYCLESMGSQVTTLRKTPERDSAVPCLIPH